MKTKTVYRVNVLVRKNFWQPSQAYDSFESLMQAMMPYLVQHSNNCSVRFFTEQVAIPEGQA